MPIKPDNIRLVRDMILAHPTQFDMGTLVGGDPNDDAEATLGGLAHPCGTVACIAGWAAYAAGYHGREGGRIEHTAAEFLGVQFDIGDLIIGGVAGRLFYPDMPEDPEAPGPYVATAEQAARVLDHLIETGEVDWSKANG